MRYIGLGQKLFYKLNPLRGLARRNRLIPHLQEAPEPPLAPVEEIPSVPHLHRDDIYEREFGMLGEYQPAKPEYLPFQDVLPSHQGIDRLAFMHSLPAAFNIPTTDEPSLNPLVEINAAVDEAKLLSPTEAPLPDGQQFEPYPPLADFPLGSAAPNLPLEAIAEQLLSNPLPADGLEGMLAEPPMGAEPPSAPEAPDMLPGM